QAFLDIKKVVHDRIALLDTGNLLFDTPSRHAADLCQDNARIDLLLQTLSELGLKKTLVGPLDQARGDDYAKQRYAKHNINTLGQQENYIINAVDYDIFVFIINKNSNKNNILKLLEKNKKHKRIKAHIAISELDREENKKLLDNFSDIDVVIQNQ